MINEHNTAVKVNKFKEQASKQREKIKGLKQVDSNIGGDEAAYQADIV